MYLFQCILIVQYIYIKVIIGLVLWRAYNYLKVINLFLFYRSLSSLRRSVVIITLHYNYSVSFSIHNLCPRPSSALANPLSFGIVFALVYNI